MCRPVVVLVAFVAVLVSTDFPTLEIDTEGGGRIILRLSRSLGGIDVNLQSAIQTEADTATDIKGGSLDGGRHSLKQGAYKGGDVRQGGLRGGTVKGGNNRNGNVSGGNTEVNNNQNNFNQSLSIPIVVNVYSDSGASTTTSLNTLARHAKKKRNEDNESESSTEENEEESMEDDQEDSSEEIDD